MNYYLKKRESQFLLHVNDVININKSKVIDMILKHLIYELI